MDDHTTVNGTAVLAIAELAKKGQEVTIVTIVGEPEKYVLSHGDKHEMFDISPPRRSHLAERIEDLAALWDGTAGADVDKPIVFYNPQGITLVYDHADRRDIATVHLQRSPTFDAVCALKARGPITQQALVELLAFHLRGVVAGGEALVSAVRSIRFGTKTEGSSTLEHGSEAIDRSLVAALTGASEIPDSFVVQVPIYTNPGLQQTHQIEISLGILPGEAKFVCRPFPGEIENAYDRQLDAVAEQLQEHLSNMPIVRGCP